MAKKKTAENVIDVPQKEQNITVNTVKTTNNLWDVKDRTYVLNGSKTPITFTLASRHHNRNPLMWWDEDKSVSRELRYASNQRSPFRDEQDGFSTLKHIVFRDGTLFVPKSQQSLQKLLSLYHPQKDLTYYELDNAADAKNDLLDIELEIEALNIAKDLDIEHAEAVLRVEQGSSVSKMTSSEIRRDLLLFCKRDPGLFINLVNDENVQLRNFAIKASEAGIISISGDQKSFYWASNNKKLMSVPFDENPYSAFAAYLKTDDGVEVYRSIEKKIK
tara:strand:+ start:131 stop:955 length:825 start_codon:yes stop_codon:yes gene_type:complete